MLATPLVHQFGSSSSSTFIGCNPVPFQNPPAHCYHSTPTSSVNPHSKSRIPRRSNNIVSQQGLACCCHPANPPIPNEAGRGAPVPVSSVDMPPVGAHTSLSSSSPTLRRRQSMEFKPKGFVSSIPLPSPLEPKVTGSSSPSQGNRHISTLNALSYGKRTGKQRSLRGVSSTPPVTTPNRTLLTSPPLTPRSLPRAKSPPPPRPPLPHLVNMPLPPLPTVPAPSRASPPPPPSRSSSPAPSSSRRRKTDNSSLLKKVILRRFAATEHGREIRRRGAHAGVLYLQTLAAARAFVVELDFACPGMESGESQNGYDYA